MKVLNSEMDAVTLGFIIAEVLLFVHLYAYYQVRPDVKKAKLNLQVLGVLLFYNTAGGLLPDPNIPLPIVTQNIIAYGGGFLAGSFMPYYLYKGFDLEKMRFHAYYGSILFLLLPYVVFFGIVYYIIKDLEIVKYSLAVPFAFACYMYFTFIQAVFYKYRNESDSGEKKRELLIVSFSILAWLLVPVTTFYNLPQSVKIASTNLGLLILIRFTVRKYINDYKQEHERLVKNAEELQKATERHLMRENAAIKAKVNFLSYQFNPHFLYNSLNAIYSLSLKRQAKEVGEVILLFSSILRYSLRNSREGLVALEEEVQYINDFIAIYRVRYGATLQVEFVQEGEAAAKKVAPLVLIGFVENAFKHGAIRDSQQPLRIELKIAEDRISFRVTNRKIRPSRSISRRTFSGVGVQSARERLELIYGSAAEKSEPDYRLDIIDEADSYQVTLKLPVRH